MRTLQVRINSVVKLSTLNVNNSRLKRKNDKLQHLESDFEHLQNNLTSLKFIPLKIRI